MKREFNEAKGFTWVDVTHTHTDVIVETQQKFSSLRDDQLKALMLQVELLSKKKGVDLHPAFEEALQTREEIMEDHKARKAQAEPD
jgi:hypothetical protein